MFSLQYYKNPEPGTAEETAMRRHIEGAVAQRQELAQKGFQTRNRDGVFGLARGYPQYWLDNHPGGADRRRWIGWLQGAGLVGGRPGEAPTTW